jgi:hypothetical protein
MAGGEGWDDRDRHHRTVRRRLDALQAMGATVTLPGLDPTTRSKSSEPT